ncbi:MogA/MoaB family molybdenum cofactor biosynthesis protein [Alteribacter keqinensis]|uniref:Molybdenum cofactor biosynthesis protein B n=1 Tax=Alteribacter keqinensis TaxID=2483800 RepID=A0A3M7TTZ0_9BACI|nr:molybdenum cofactor biosynthesis protein B [Alteribacter keqinensis]RNA69098.1 molybdenum cofactor biosynthesis protein MoaB [Alteribacter keqinensis]
MSVHEHKKQAPRHINCIVLTVSDTRTMETDKSGRLMKSYLEENGHAVLDHRIVEDDFTAIQKGVLAAQLDERVDALLINGGTGLALRDITYEAVERMLDKTIPGFGELFRYLSYEKDIGSAAMLSRAIAGVRGKTVIFSTPGSSGAVKLAMESLIIPEIGHVVREVRKDL